MFKYKMRSFNYRIVLPMVILLIESVARGQGAPATRTYEYDAQGNRTRASQQLRIPGLQIQAFEPPSGLPGDVINIYGRNLRQAENLSVTIQGKPAAILRRADSVMSVQVPLDAETGPVVMTVAGNNPLELGTFTIRKDLDRDGDKLPNFVEPLIGLDPDKADSDNNGVIDGDEDSDADHLSNYGEIVMGTSMNNPDSNRDGILDGDHDTDKDELTDGEEIPLGTDPRNPDTDGDIWPDGVEVAYKGDPVDPKIGVNLYTAPTSRVLVVAPGIGQANQAPNIQVASPLVDVLLPGLGDQGQYQGNTIVAQPWVDVLLPGLGESGEMPLQLIVAEPLVTILLPDLGTDQSKEPNLVLSQPPIQVLLSGQGSSQGISPNMTLAKPPVRVKVEQPGLVKKTSRTSSGN